MPAFTLATFEQGRFLQNETDPAVAGGVCVALSNIWLQSIMTKRKVEAQHRMQYLATMMGQAKADQKKYGDLRDWFGPVDARAQIGRDRNIDYEERTVVEARFVGLAGLLSRLAGDLKPPGARATWSMRFAGGGGHAIAGINMFSPITPNVAKMSFNLFDPNIGEYVAPYSSLDVIVADLFKRCPIYGTVVTLRRLEARGL